CPSPTNAGTSTRWPSGLTTSRRSGSSTGPPPFTSWVEFPLRRVAGPSRLAGSSRLPSPRTRSGPDSRVGSRGGGSGDLGDGTDRARKHEGSGAVQEREAGGAERRRTNSHRPATSPQVLGACESVRDGVGSTSDMRDVKLIPRGFEP